jgi:hypothetical protein
MNLILCNNKKSNRKTGHFTGRNDYRFLVAFLLFPPAFTAGARDPTPFTLDNDVLLWGASDSADEDASSSSACESVGFDVASVSFMVNP